MVAMRTPWCWKPSLSPGSAAWQVAQPMPRAACLESRHWATIAGDVLPMLCGSAFKNKGVQPLLDAVVDFLPSPLESKTITGKDPKTEDDITRKADDNEPFAALAFKIATDPYGNLTYSQTGSQTVKTPFGDYTVPTSTATQSYSPVGQQQLAYTEATGLNLGQAGSELSGQIANTLSNPIQLPSTPDFTNQSIQNQLYSEYSPFMNQQLGNQQNQLQSQLQGQGATPGSPA